MLFYGHSSEKISVSASFVTVYLNFEHILTPVCFFKKKQTKKNPNLPFVKIGQVCKCSSDQRATEDSPIYILTINSLTFQSGTQKSSCVHVCTVHALQ